MVRGYLGKTEVERDGVVGKHILKVDYMHLQFGTVGFYVGFVTREHLVKRGVKVMSTRIKAKCVHVHDGDTFQTARGRWIRLAGVNTPEEGTSGWLKAKRALEGIILGKIVTYEPIGRSYHRVVANVWVGNRSVNAYMHRLGY